MVNNNYLYNTVYSKIEDFIPEKGSTYIYGYSTEERSHCVDDLIMKHDEYVNFVKLQDSEKDLIIDLVSNQKYFLRSSKSIEGFLLSHPTSILYIDVTGLNNRVSASLLNNAIKYKQTANILEIKVVYAEPATYNIKRFKSEGVFHDLSEQIEGIEPLPGFATIIPDYIDDIQFIALLGFEGGRFIHMLENVQPPKDNIIPIIGVPGFRIEYPFVAYWGNRRPLVDTESWRNVKYAAANSIVDAYFLLSNILKKSSCTKIKVAPIGTKPHAIGAILFAIKNTQNVELIYDNPIRKKERTQGVGQIIVCAVSKLIEEN
jgi:hypothetical protein